MDHPLMAVWSVEILLQGRPRRELATMACHADGSMVLATSGYAAQGVWSATGAQTARATAIAPLGPAEGQPGWQTLDLVIEVAQDTRALSLEGSHSRPTPSGIPTTTAISGSGQRLIVSGV